MPAGRAVRLRGGRSCADSGPARTAVLRGQRQRGSPLWNPVCRLRAGVGLCLTVGLCPAVERSFYRFFEKEVAETGKL